MTKDKATESDIVELSDNLQSIAKWAHLKSRTEAILKACQSYGDLLELPKRELDQESLRRHNALVTVIRLCSK